jgi:hypothetical protein
MTADMRRYFTNPIADGHGTGATASEPLWWPPTKIAGRYLGPWLTTHARPASFRAAAGHPQSEVHLSS